LWFAKNRSGAQQPPFPCDIRDAAWRDHRGTNGSLCPARLGFAFLEQKQAVFEETDSRGLVLRDGKGITE